MKRRTLMAIGALTLGTVLAPTVAGAAPAGPGAPGWHVGYYTPSGRALSMSEAAPTAGGGAMFPFTNQPNTALLIATQGSSSLLGNDLGETIHATFTISGVTGSFMAYPDQCYPNGAAPNVRLFFETSNAGGYANTHYWWADVASSPLANGSETLTATISPTSPWSDLNGKASGDNSSAFADAASNVTAIGLSFGGYCHYESGVGTSNGSGTFTLTSYTVAAP